MQATASPDKPRLWLDSRVVTDQQAVRPAWICQHQVGQPSKDDDHPQRQFQEHTVPYLGLSDQQDLAYFAERMPFLALAAAKPDGHEYD
jgi:hypothetical protein